MFYDQGRALPKDKGFDSKPAGQTKSVSTTVKRKLLSDRYNTADSINNF